MVNNWYMQNLVQIGPHTREMAEGIKQEKLDELRDIDPVIDNSKEIWEGVLPRMFVTITGEGYLYNETVQDILQLIQFETDPNRVNFLLDMMYKIRGINVPPKAEEQPPESQEALAQASPDQNQLLREAEVPMLQ